MGDSGVIARLGTPAGASLAADLLTIDNLVDDLEAAVGTIEGATTLHNKLTAARAALLDGLTAVRLAELDAANIPADIDTLLTRLTALRAGYLDELGAANVPADIDTLLTRLSAVRAGYLDNLSAGAVALAATALSTATWTGARAGYLDELAAANIPTDVDGLKTSRDRQLFSMDFWSAPQEEVAIPAVGAAATLTLPTVTVADLPAGAIVVRAIAMLKCRMIENTNVAANKLSGATVAATSQVIQVRDDTPGTWRDAITFVDDQFGMAASTREGGDVLIGDTDIAVEVDGNDGYNFQYLLAAADVANLNLNDVAVGLKIWYSV